MSREFERPKEVTADHLAGWAGCYARQSSERQVRENKGSLKYQRGQAQWARRWGWPDAAIKPYEDAGLSGVAADHRPAFMAMIADIKAKRLRAVFAADQSRLARNSIEWFTFLEVCRTSMVLLCLDGRIIRLGDDGDEFSSRVVAFVDEFDNKKRRATFLRGILGKIESGKAYGAADGIHLTGRRWLGPRSGHRRADGHCGSLSRLRGRALVRAHGGRAPTARPADPASQAGEGRTVGRAERPGRADDPQQPECGWSVGGDTTRLI